MSGSPKTNYLLVGAPNSGKSSLFNMLTGQTRPVGNRPGVTVERFIAPIAHNPSILLEDLPGINYIDSHWEQCSIDYQVTLKRLDTLQSNDVIVNVLDARSLRRQLYLSLQLLELHKPMLIVLKFGSKSGLKQQLQQALGIPVFDEAELLQKHWADLPSSSSKPPHLGPLGLQQDYWLSIKNLSSNILLSTEISTSESMKHYLHRHQLSDDPEALLALWRHRWIESQSFPEPAAYFSQTELLDSLFLHKIWGLPLFLLIMYTVFSVTIRLGAFGTDCLQAPVDVIMSALSDFLCLSGVAATLLDGFYLGVTTVISFLAPLALLYAALGLLEQTGYMQRAAVVIDRLMQWMKLPGQSFIPFVVGFGCNVPGIMATRTLQNPVDRLQTILMSPFMSCSARLAIFTVFTKAFFDERQGGYIIFSLYVLGFVIAVLTGLMMRISLPQSSYSPLVQEIVPYQWPQMRLLIKASFQRLQDFAVKAAQMIIPSSMLIHTVVNHGFSMSPVWFKPFIFIFEPMGLGEKEWPAIFSLLAGLIAKEILLGTLEGLQNPPAMTRGLEVELLGVNESLSSPAVEQKLVMLFSSPQAAMSYLIFVLLYFPCISVTSTIAQESKRFWAFFSVAWSTSIAYITAVLYYQYSAGQQSMTFLILLTLCSGLYLWLITLFLQKKLGEAKQYHPIHFKLKHS